MSPQFGFLDKLVSRMNRLDPKSLQTQFYNLARERGLLETIFQSIQEGVMVVSADGRLFYANKAAEQMFGFELSRMRGRPISRYIYDIDWERLASNEESEWAKISTSEIEVFMPMKRIFSIYAVPMEDGPDDAGPCVVTILRDVTKERESEESILESERMHAIHLLASSIAHEIGNPLNALGIHLQILEREVKSISNDAQKNLSDLVSVARSEVSRLDLIISKFLRALRPGIPEFVKSNILEIIQDSLRVMKSDIEEHQMDVSVVALNELPGVMVDPQQMKQVFFNIVKNALEAMSDGGRLQISVSADDRDITIAFKDTGVGIDAADLNRLFEPYHTAKEKGNGLGLTIAQRIVQGHGGRLEVSSKVGIGTCFRIILPIADRRVRLLSKS